MVTIIGLILVVTGMLLAVPLVAAAGAAVLLVGLISLVLESADDGTRAHYW